MVAIYYGFICFLFVLSVPLQFILFCIILLVSGTPVIYKQKRVGLNGKIFTIYKFRTMVRDAEKHQSNYSRSNEADGPVFKIHNDPRFTPLGSFLSHTGMDEFPQLWNVLIGDMSLIGPRPLPVNEAKKLKKWQLYRHTVKPGIISPWVLDGYHSEPFISWMKSDVSYAYKKNLKTDIQLFFRMLPYIAKLFIQEVFFRKTYTANTIYQ